MEDKQELAIAGYDVTVRRRYRSRGGWLLETSEGPRLLREYESIRSHFHVENKIKDHLIEKGFSAIDQVIQTREGDMVMSLESGEKYVMYRWFSGEECDLRIESNLMMAGENLGRLHHALADCEDSILFAEAEENSERGPLGEEELLSVYLRHNRELGRVNRYMKSKKKKTEFEIEAIHSFSSYNEKAKEAAERLNNCRYYQELAEMPPVLCHGDYNYHNLLLSGKQVYTTGFEKAAAGIQLLDLTYFMRKTLEKNEWRTEAGEAVLCGYQKSHSLNPAQMEFIGITLLYPEKYWKLLNQYYNKKKSWLSAKSLEKLKNVGKQERKREKYLRFFEEKYC